MIYHIYDMKRIHFEQIPSTHLFAKEQMERLKDFDLTVITADFQTAGIGRRRTPWIAPSGSSLLATLVYKAPSQEHIPFISINASKALMQCLNLPITIKYPNDLMVNGKKIAGIISETSDGMAITSIGLNVSQTEKEMSHIDQPATSLFIETGHNFCNDDILAKFCMIFFP